MLLIKRETLYWLLSNNCKIKTRNMIKKYKNKVISKPNSCIFTIEKDSSPIKLIINIITKTPLRNQRNLKCPKASWMSQLNFTIKSKKTYRLVILSIIKTKQSKREQHRKLFVDLSQSSSILHLNEMLLKTEARNQLK